MSNTTMIRAKRLSGLLDGHSFELTLDNRGTKDCRFARSGPEEGIYEQIWISGSGELGEVVSASTSCTVACTAAMNASI